MGCHTWFYTKINPQPSWEDIKEDNKDRILKEIKCLETIIDRTMDEELLEAYPEWTKEYGEKHIVIAQEELEDLLNTDNDKLKYYYRYKSNVLGTLTVYDKNKNLFYNNNNMPHGLFRIGGYPDDRLFSLEETLAYLDKNKEFITTYDYTIESVTKFWNENPEGLIEFG